MKKKHRAAAVAEAGVGAGVPPKSQHKPKSDHATAVSTGNGWEDSDSPPTQQVQSAATVRSVSVSPATDLTPVPIFESPAPSANKSTSRKGAGWAVPPRDSRILSSSGRKPKSLHDRKTQSSSSRSHKTRQQRQVKSAELASARNRAVCSRKSASASIVKRHRSSMTTAGTKKGGQTELDPICLFDDPAPHSSEQHGGVNGLEISSAGPDDAPLPDSEDVGLSVSQPQPDVSIHCPVDRIATRRHMAHRYSH